MNKFRPEIQGLRAVAVAAVVIYHIWPQVLPGGFVGVDVFFVISGYLITGLLFREAQERGAIALPLFYGRRIRRLLPAASVVLLAVALATPLLPEDRWEETAIEIAASALYVENWRLAWSSVDYLASENAPSPVQHYWSLSIEEQFYLVWPLIIAGAAFLTRHAKNRLWMVSFLTLAVITGTSLLYSIIFTARTPEAAYFVTFSRAWELGLGGLLALAPALSLSPALREFMRFAGIGAISLACFTFSADTAFPSYAALLPTLGAALVIAAAGGSENPWSTYRLLKAPAAQYIGDISYSLYLWHWPIIIFYLALVDEPISLSSGFLVLAICVVISALSKRLIEDPFRRPAERRIRAVRTIGWGGASVTACVVASGAIFLLVEAQRPVAATNPSQAAYPGVAAILSDAKVPDGIEPIPPLATVKKDTPDIYDNGCHLRFKDTEPNPCEYGNPDATFHVFLVGDSHAANWVPALRVLADKRGWRLTTHTKSSCALLSARISRKGKAYEECFEWGKNVLDLIRREQPDLVLWARSAMGRLWLDDKSSEQGITIEDVISHTWQQILKAGTRLVVIADTPRLPFEPGECLSRKKNCVVPLNDAFPKDPILQVQSVSPDVALINMNDALCDSEGCPVVIGNIIAWRDKHHLTATFARGLASLLGQRLDVVLAAP